MMKGISVILSDKIDILDRFGTLLFCANYDDFKWSKYALLDYMLYVYDSGVKIKILEPIVE